MGIGKLDTAGRWAVNGTPIYVPSMDGVTYDHDNIASSDSGRTEDGTMHITWVRRDVRKVSLTYNYLTGREVEYMRDLMQGREFTFTYYDNGVKTMNGYCGKCSYSELTTALFPEDGGIAKDFKINVEEM